jgi:hypothetical protein
MGAKRLDLAGDKLGIEQGALYSQILQYNAPVDPPTNPPTFEGVDLTGYTVKSQVKQEYGYATYIELDDYIVLNAGGVLGAISIIIPDEITTTYVPGVYKYDLFLTPADGGPQKLIYGIFEIRPSVTQ